MYEAGVQRFTMSLSQWIDKTGAVGVISKAGKTLREVAVSQLKSLRASKDIEHILMQSPKSKTILEKKDDKNSN